MPRQRSSWTLTREAFDTLLERLSPDRETASREFESLRKQIIALLTWAGAQDPEHLTDTVFDRAAKHLSEGDEIASLKAWMRGAARNVFRESLLQQRKEAELIKNPFVVADHPPENDLQVLEKCMRQLPPRSRSLMERYYDNKGKGLLTRRKELAAELGISMEALRARALRLRRRLEECMSSHSEPEGNST